MDGSKLVAINVHKMNESWHHVICQEALLDRSEEQITLTYAATLSLSPFVRHSRGQM